MYRANILEAFWFSFPLNISLEAVFRVSPLITYMLQFFPPAKPHAGRVVLLPHSCYYGTHWRPRGCDAEPYPLTSLVLAARRPTFPPELHVCETVGAKVCQPWLKKKIWTRYSYWMWYKIFVFNSFSFNKMNANSHEQELYIPQMHQHMAVFRSIPPPLLANIHNEMHEILFFKIQAWSSQMSASAWLSLL